MMKNLCLIFTLFILPTLGFSQFIGDTVIVYIDNRVEIKVAIPDYSELKEAGHVTGALEEFKKLLPALQGQLSPERADLIRFTPGQGPTIEPGDPKIIFLMKDGEINDAEVDFCADLANRLGFKKVIVGVLIGKIQRGIDEGLTRKEIFKEAKPFINY